MGEHRDVAAAVGLVLLVRARGLGTGRTRGWAASTGTPARLHSRRGLVLTVIVVGALLPWTRPVFLNDRYATFSGAVVASMIVIPLQTVIPEELAFRGVLHGALDQA